MPDNLHLLVLNKRKIAKSLAEAKSGAESRSQSIELRQIGASAVAPRGGPAAPAHAGHNQPP